MEIIQRANHLYVRTCPCRAREQHCLTGTWDVCLLFERADPHDLRQARPVTRDEALSIFEATLQRGSIYNLFYTHTEQTITELCSCCTCCCRPLRRMKDAGDYRQQPRSNYIAVTDHSRCTACGACTSSCFFEARIVQGNTLRTIAEDCFGCGKCLPNCPQQAIQLVPQAGRGLTIPVKI
ncbi:MAG: 4Fe-4S binding protein [Chloroflexi bacterium]|nr:4Fe-4S binding protein [Chloroflexota bacterium]